MFKRFVNSEDPRIHLKMLAVIAEGFLVLAVIFVFLNMTFGWFAKNRTLSARGMSVTPYEIVYPTMHAWRFDLNDEASGETLDKSGTWVDAIDPNSPPEADGILPVVQNTYGAGETGERYTFRSLHLGTVDNLISLSNDNYFYVRFDVTDASCLNQTVLAGFELTAADVHFYDLEGQEQTSVLTAAQKQDLADIFDAECVVSASAYDPITNQAALETLFENSGTRLTNGAAPQSFGLQSSAYYLYLRFSPDLERCFEATNEVSIYMPCELTFDASVNVVFG